MKPVTAWKWMDWFLPEAERSDPFRLRRGRLLAGLLLLATLPQPLFTGHYLLTGNTPMVLSSGLFMVLFTGLLVGFRHLGAAIVTHMLLLIGTAGIFVFVLQTGGLTSFVAPYTAVLPMMAVAMLDRWWGRGLGRDRGLLCAGVVRH